MSEGSLHYDRVASGYDQPRHRFFYGHVAEILCILARDYIRPRTILDVGCGTGVSTVELRKYFPWAEIVALDKSLPMLTIAKKKNMGKSVLFHHGTAENIVQPTRKSELILASMSFHWLSSQERLALAEALPENGVMAVSFPLNMAVKRKEGNRVLLEAFREIKRSSRDWRPSRSTRGLTWNDLRKSLPGLQLLHADSYCMEEEFKKREDLIEVLRVRGALCGLFGEKADLAEDYLRRAMPEDVSVSYVWLVGIAILGRDSNRHRKSARSEQFFS